MVVIKVDLRHRKYDQVEVSLYISTISRYTKWKMHFPKGKHNIY